MSYRGEGCSLSFHIPPVFQGLVLWVVCSLEKDFHIIVLRNKRRILFADKRTPGTGGWIRYVIRSEMAMEDYCGDDELELYISTPRKYLFQPAQIKECGVHVITEKLDSFEESVVERDTMMPSPLSYHLLHHPPCGSITASTPKQWSDYLFPKLHKYNLDLWL
jgi:leucine-rich repeat protein SHOC2